MRIVSINCSKGQTVLWKGKEVRTSIFKTPVDGPVMIERLNVAGDRQSDLRVHGGLDKAVYSYDLQDYDWWRAELNKELTPGAFGENLTTDGVLDRTICVGDVVQVGSALLQASQPRLPCYKLGVKFEDELMPKRFMKARRWGIYFRVLQEGLVQADDEVTLITEEPQRVTIAQLAEMATTRTPDISLIERALAIPSLTESWKNALSEIALQ
jgi:MOSC domain-containing protein YiiM